MARTKASACRKSSGGKAPRKALANGAAPKITTSSSGRSHSKGSKGSANKKTKGTSSINGVCQRSTPEWQKKITLFMNNSSDKAENNISKADLESPNDDMDSLAGCSGTQLNNAESDCEVMEDKENQLPADEMEYSGEEENVEEEEANSADTNENDITDKSNEVLHNENNDDLEIMDSSEDENMEKEKTKQTNGVDTNEDCDKEENVAKGTNSAGTNEENGVADTSNKVLHNKNDDLEKMDSSEDENVEKETEHQANGVDENEDGSDTAEKVDNSDVKNKNNIVNSNEDNSVTDRSNTNEDCVNMEIKTDDPIDNVKKSELGVGELDSGIYENEDSFSHSKEENVDGTIRDKEKNCSSEMEEKSSDVTNEKLEGVASKAEENDDKEQKCTAENVTDSDTVKKED